MTKIISRCSEENATNSHAADESSGGNVAPFFLVAVPKYRFALIHLQSH